MKDTLHQMPLSVSFSSQVCSPLLQSYSVHFRRFHLPAPPSLSVHRHQPYELHQFPGPQSLQTRPRLTLHVHEEIQIEKQNVKN